MAGRWLPKTFTLSVWLVAALCATYWSLKFAGSTSTPTSLAEVGAPVAESDPALLAKVFGPPPVALPVAVANVPRPVDPSTRFSLLGVVAGRASNGVALISVEGKTARPYRVGSQIDEAYRLKSVEKRTATLVSLADENTAFTLELAKAAASTGLPGLPPPAAVPGAPSVVPLDQVPPTLRSLRPPRTRESAI